MEVNKIRCEALIEASVLCHRIAREEMSKSDPNVGLVTGATKCGYEIDCLLSKEFGIDMATL